MDIDYDGFHSNENAMRNSIKNLKETVDRERDKKHLTSSGCKIKTCVFLCLACI